MSERTIIVGDVHGMLDPLVALIHRVEPASGDTLVFLGDLLDKGPDSAGVVRYVRGLRARAAVVLIQGNHEGKHQRWRKKVQNGDVAGALAMKGGAEIGRIAATLSADDVAFLESAVLFHRSDGYLFLHAGIPGDLHAIPAHPAALLTLPPRARKRLELLTYTRYLDRSSGRMLPLGEETDQDPFWAEVYDGRFGRVIFGHQPWKSGPRHFPHAVGIDTGAVHGFGLTALVLDQGSESFHTVPTRQYADFLGDD